MQRSCRPWAPDAATSRSWERQGNRFSPQASKEYSPASSLTVGETLSNFDLQNTKIINLLFEGEKGNAFSTYDAEVMNMCPEEELFPVFPMTASHIVSKEAASLLTQAEVVNSQRTQTNEDRDPAANQPPAELG